MSKREERENMDGLLGLDKKRAASLKALERAAIAYKRALDRWMENVNPMLTKQLDSKLGVVHHKLLTKACKYAAARAKETRNGKR